MGLTSPTGGGGGVQNPTNGTDFEVSAGDGIILNENAALGTPDTNKGVIYLKTGGTFAVKNDAGVETEVGSGFNAWDPYRLNVLTQPPTTGWTWDNQGSAVLTENAAGSLLDVTGAAGVNLRIQHRTAPATPYTATAKFRIWCPATSQVFFGLCVRNSSDGKVIAGGALHTGGVWKAFVGEYTNSTTFSANRTNVTLLRWENVVANNYMLGDEIYIRHRDDGVDLEFDYSFDGVAFTEFSSAANTTFTTYDQIGWFGQQEVLGADNHLYAQLVDYVGA